MRSAEHANANLRGLQESGIRGYFLYGGPGPTSDTPNPPHPLDARRMRDEHFPKGVNGRLRMGMALRGPCFTSAERNTEDFKFARELGLPISTHVGMAGTADAIIVLDRFGLLGSDVNYVHANMLTDKEFDLIAKSKSTISLTPSTDMLMQFGTFPATGPALQRVNNTVSTWVALSGTHAPRALPSPPWAAVTDAPEITPKRTVRWLCIFI